MREDQPVQPPVAAGEIVAGKYRVGEVLGAGGMGVVLAGEHVSFSQRVAIKFMRPDAGAQALKRFHREANIVVQLRSEHVCRVIDHGAIASGAMYIVMERLEGRDLEQVVSASGAVAPQDAVEYVLQASEALAEAHLLGVVHRDIKPSNLFLTLRPDGSPCIKLLDFGISKVRDTVAALTATGSLLGSVHFMSPEQLDDVKTVDLRSDIWSLGATLYELLAGEMPFEAPSLSEIAIKIMCDPVRDLGSCAPGLAVIAPVVERCLAKNPDDRYANLAELALSLRPHASKRALPYVDRIVGMYERSGWVPPTGHRTGTVADVDAMVAAGPTQLAVTADQLAAQPAPDPRQMETLEAMPRSAGLPTFVSKSPPPRRRGWVAMLLAFGLLAIAAVALFGLWEVSAGGDDESASAEGDHGKARGKKKKKKRKAARSDDAPSDDAPSDDASETPAPRAPGSGSDDGDAPATWREAAECLRSLIRARTAAARVYRLRFYKDYVEVELFTDPSAPALERFIWQRGSLGPPEADDRELSEEDARNGVLPLSKLDSRSIARVRNDALSRQSSTAREVTSIELRVQGGVGSWDVRIWGEVFSYDLSGSYRPKAW